MLDEFEVGDTALFTITFSTAPNSAPLLMITGVSTTTPVASLTSASSDSTHYYVPYTIPSTTGQYMGRWYAESTLVSSTYPFNKRFLFNVINTQRR